MSHIFLMQETIVNSLPPWSEDCNPREPGFPPSRTSPGTSRSDDCSSASNTGQPLQRLNPENLPDSPYFWRGKPAQRLFLQAQLCSLEVPTTLAVGLQTPGTQFIFLNFFWFKIHVRIFLSTFWSATVESRGKTKARKCCISKDLIQWQLIYLGDFSLWSVFQSLL